MREVKDVEAEFAAQRGALRIPEQLTVVGNRESMLQSFNETEPDRIQEEQAEPAEEKIEAQGEPEKEPDKWEPEAKEPDKEKEKTVPLEALHEERQKRKELARKVRELEEAFKQAAEDNKKLTEILTSMKSKDDEPIEDYEREIRYLKRKLKEAEEKIESVSAQYGKKIEAFSRDAMMANIRATADELAASGYEGFMDFIPQVVNAMRDEGIAPEEETPDIWKRIYKEVVYPKYIGKYRTPKAEKEEAKKSAKLATSPGAKPSKPATTPESYAEWRQKVSFL